MAEDAPPISTTVTETTTFDTGADKQTLGDLNKEFADFWSEQDTKPEPAPEAPGESTGAAQETKPDKEPDKKPTPTPQTPPPEPVSTPKEVTTSAPKQKEYTDEEIDELGKRPNTRPEVESDFKQIRDLWKADRARLKEIQARSTQLEQELNSAKENAWTPEQKADYEQASALRRKFDLASDPEFIAKYHTPIQNTYQQLLQQVVAALPDKEQATAWAQHMLQTYSPDQLSQQWWEEKVLDKIPGEVARQRALARVTQMLDMMTDRDTELNRVTGEKSAWDRFLQDRFQQTSERVQRQIMDEIATQEKKIQDYLPRNAEEAKTNEERAAIEAHNARFNKLNENFKTRLQDLSANGPPAWVRVNIEATRAEILDEEIRSVREELDAVKAERDSFKAELDKIAGARRKLANTTGTPPASTQKKNGSLTLKDLDVRKSFENFDWGETT